MKLCPEANECERAWCDATCNLWWELERLDEADQHEGGGLVREKVKRYLIVSRHPATVEYLRRWVPADTPVLAEATIKDVEGCHVFGNLPLYLAAKAAEVYAVEFYNTPPRGAEYTLQQMLDAEVHLSRYIVVSRPLADPEHD